MNWLITGGCGFIGSRLIADLLVEGEHQVRIVDDLSVGKADSLPVGVTVTELAASQIAGAPVGLELLIADVTDMSAMRVAATGCDVIVHLAANTGVGPSVEDPVSDCRVNVLGTIAVLEAARANGVGRFVFASSGAPVGEVEPPIHENLPARPVSPYGASKLAGEGYCSAYAHSFGVDSVALRFGNVYGPGSGHKSSVVAKFIKSSLAGETLEIYGDGSQTRDFIYLDDLIRALRLAASVEGIGGEVFQIATNRETNLRELIDALRIAFEARLLKLGDVVFTEPRRGDVMRNFSDTSKAAERLGWQSKIALQEGLVATLDDFLDERGSTST